ncbi:MAG: hypothetical protein AMJ69_08655 [Gammaproteobacteria bacterium SG8_47]|nr:MAG: hypothetical protein AMJ69_08655 [Gammaproteobacteria bacterium SG8_47]
MIAQTQVDGCAVQRLFQIALLIKNVTTMQPSIDIVSIVFLIGAAQAVFFAALLVSPRQSNRRANAILALFLIAFAFTLIEAFLTYTRLYVAHPQLLGLLWPIDFLYGPLFYAYVRALTCPSFRLTKGKLLHLLPFLISVASFIPFVLLSSHGKVALLAGELSPGPYHAVIGLNMLAAMIQIMVYLGLSLWRLRQHRKAIQDTLSYREGADLRWLTNLALVCVVLWLLYVLRDLLLPMAGVEVASYWLLPLAIALGIYALSYWGHRQSQVFVDDTPDLQSVTRQPKYQKSALSGTQSNEISQRLTEAMDRDKPFLDSELTLKALAERLGASPNHLSQVINERIGTSFFDLVNTYRVREAKTLLTDPVEQHSSILAISLEAGFKSKSAFYNAFRKHTGVTPHQYRVAAGGDSVRQAEA